MERPVISLQSKSRVESLIAAGEKQAQKSYSMAAIRKFPITELGNFVKPTILDNVPANSQPADTEIFGPVSKRFTPTTMSGVAFLERSPYGNQASLFTSSGAAARRFRYEAPARKYLGINIGVAAPMAYFPFSGWKRQLLRYPEGRDSIEFYTEEKVVIERG